MRKTTWMTSLCVVSLAAGCGTNLTEALLLAGESGVRTALDVFVSDFVSDLPELFSLPPGPGEPVDNDSAGGNGGDQDGAGGQADGGTGPTDGGAGPGDGGGEVLGDAAAGMVLFGGNSCGLCHCEDASGGCLPGAPNIQGSDLATVRERLQGETAHPGGKFPDLSEQDLADITAFLDE